LECTSNVRCGCNIRQLIQQKFGRVDSGKLAISPDQPRRRIKVKLCMLGGLRRVASCFSCFSFNCDPNGLRGYFDVGVENGPSPLLWPVAYTTACTTVQAVIVETMWRLCRDLQDFAQEGIY